MSLTLVLVILSLVVLLLATINDIKTREVPDTLSYGFILAVFGIRAIYATQEGITVFLYGIIGFVVMLLFGLVMYYSKQWGGGDSKIFMGLGAAYADFWLNQIPFIFIILAFVLLIGTIYGSVWGAWIFYKHRKKTIPYFKKKINEKRKFLLYFFGLGLIFLFSTLLVDSLYLRLILLFLAISSCVTFYLYYFIKVIEDIGFIQRLPLAKVTEGDWLAKDIIVNGKIICSTKKACIDKKQISLMKKNNIKHVTIKIGIPFLPPIFIGVVISLVFYFF